MPPFSPKDVRDLYSQYTAETNQPFTKEAVLYKETFVKIVFHQVKYRPNDKEQSWLEQYGLIKRKEKTVVVANNIYKERFIETFFSETEVSEDISKERYVLPRTGIGSHR